jgi:hypothetical protein
MMRLLRSIRRREQGQMLILSAFIILIFASLGIVPILSFMGTGIVTARNTGLHTREIYAAEAGVYDSIWKIILIVPGVPRWPSNPPLQYSITAGVDGKSVNVTLTKIDDETYRIHSVATDPDTGHQSTVESDVVIGTPGGLDLSAFATFAMTSQGSITTKLSDDINGNVWIPSSANYSGALPSGEIITDPITGWPPQDLLETYFSLLVDTSSPYSNNVINISNPSQTGPLYVHGASNPNYVMTGTGNLTGAFYVDGNLALDNNAHVSLDGNTIFVMGDVSTSPQSSVAGPGAIIAIGNIVFSPQVTPSFIFIMSVSGSVNFQPQGDFVGSVSGNVTINIQPNCSLTWQDPGVGNLDLPGLFNHIQDIKTWSIK